MIHGLRITSKESMRGVKSSKHNYLNYKTQSMIKACQTKSLARLQRIVEASEKNKFSKLSSLLS